MAQFQSRRCQQRCPADLTGALLPPPAAQNTEQGVAPEAAVQRHCRWRCLAWVHGQTSQEPGPRPLIRTELGHLKPLWKCLSYAATTLIDTRGELGEFKAGKWGFDGAGGQGAEGVYNERIKCE